MQRPFRGLNCRSRANDKNVVITITYDILPDLWRGQKRPFCGLDPAKNSRRGGGGKYPLTIPA
jgi:hypothetical protein